MLHVVMDGVELGEDLSGIKCRGLRMCHMCFQVCGVVDMWVDPTFAHSTRMLMETGPDVGWVERKGPVHSVSVATGYSTLRIQLG
jgi:hypothetical protein